MNYQKKLKQLPTKKYIKHFSGTTWIDSWKSNGMSEEDIENATKSGSNFASTFADYHLLPDINFNGHCLIKNDISIPKNVINLYISYKLNPQLRNLNTSFTLNNCLLDIMLIIAVDKYKYSGYGIAFDSRSEFLFTNKSYWKNVITFGSNMSSSVDIDNNW